MSDETHDRFIQDDEDRGAATVAARQAAEARRTPPDPSAPAASPDSGNPGAVPTPSAAGSPSDPNTPPRDNPAYGGSNDPYDPPT